MNNYDFAELLSPTRFEQLSRDLLQSEYGNFENFADGRDNGIDFRYSVNEEQYLLVVQCKRYKKHNYPSLKASLKKEVRKIKKKNITEYLLVTSVDLTPNNKAEIVKLFQGVIKNENQIFTRGDLNFRLGQKQNEYVEFKYPELWMSSINIHQKIFKLGFLKNSEFISTKIKKALTTFVEHEVYHHALNHLKKENSVIISGIPGIGKTTLSYVVIAHFIKFHDFKLIDVSYRHIEHAEDFIYDSHPIIFFLDDFLGRTKLDKKEGEANLIFEFIQKIENSKRHKLIISTREYILKKAESEFYSAIEFKNFTEKYVIELKSLTRKTRAQIFYNHLINTDLPFNFIQELLKNNYIFLIDHKNYSPRIIEHLTSKQFLKGIKSKEYFRFFNSNLNDSSKVWEHVFYNLPNDVYKAILFYLYLMDLPATYESIELTINSLIKNDKKFQHFELDIFEVAIKEMEGTFIVLLENYDDLLDKELSSIEFYNPSVQDFIESIFWDRMNWIELLIKNAKYYEQIFNFDLIEIIGEDDFLQEVFIKKLIKDFGDLENSSYGYDSYDFEGEFFHSHKSFKRLAHFVPVLDYINYENNLSFKEFLAKESIRYEINLVNSIEERDSFLYIAKHLIQDGLLEPYEVLKHYCEQIFRYRKEIVILEYFSREYPKAEKQLVQDNKLLDRIDHIFLLDLQEEKDLTGAFLFEYLEDYSQIKDNLAPLPKTEKRLQYLKSIGILDNYLKRKDEEMKERRVKFEKEEKEFKEKNDYYDIKDEEIKKLFDELLHKSDSNENKA